MGKIALLKNDSIAKSNRLNEFQPNDLKLQELRFLNIYLSKINPTNKRSRVVRFPINDFRTIMDLDGRINIKHIKRTTEGLLRKVVTIWDEGVEGYSQFQLFKKCIVSRNDFGEWYVEIDAHDDALPLMFELKSHYFRYELWNTLSLTGHNQLRMYEILKQCEKIGHRIVEIMELRKMLGVEKDEYPRYNSFRERVLDPCQKALSEKTDIAFTYGSHGKKGPGGKILTLKFKITKNEKYKSPINLEKFIDLSVAGQRHKMAASEHVENINPDPENPVLYPLNSAEPAENLTEFTEVAHYANFEIFWQAYPEHKQKGKIPALNEWIKLPRIKSLFEDIMTGLERAKKSQDWINDNGRYIIEPKRWLKEGRWEDSYSDHTHKSENKKSNKSRSHNFNNSSSREWDFEKLEILNMIHMYEESGDIEAVERILSSLASGKGTKAEKAREIIAERKNVGFQNNALSV